MPRLPGPGQEGGGLPTVKPWRPRPHGGGLLAKKCCCAPGGEQATQCPPIDSCLNCAEDYDATFLGIFLFAIGGGGRFAFNARMRYDHDSEAWPPEFCRYAGNLPLCVVEDLEYEGETEGVSWEFGTDLINRRLHCAVLEHEGEYLAWWQATFDIHVYWHQGEPGAEHGVFRGWRLKPRMTDESCVGLGSYDLCVLWEPDLIINPGTFDLAVPGQGF